MAIETLENQELFEETTTKVNRHVSIALNHLNKRRDVLVAQNLKIAKEILEINTAIEALG
jgi:hypothetical protein